jgi:hypothetical protein
MPYATFESSLKKVTKQIRDAADTSAQEAAKEWAEGMVRIMEESTPQGLLYWYPGRGWTRASAPGQPPAIQSGNYARSITVRKDGEGIYSAGSPEMLGLWLEKGTSKMAPRPHIWRGYQRNKASVVKALYESWEKLG